MFLLIDFKRKLCYNKEKYIKDKDMSYIYISYADGSQSAAALLKKHLSLYFNTWCPADDLLEDENPADVIPGKIKEASAVLVVLTPETMKSKQTRREIGIADKYSVPLVPVSFGAVAPDEFFEYYFSGIETLNIEEISSDPLSVSQLIKALREYAGRMDYDDLIKIELDEEPEEEEPVPVPVFDNTEIKDRIKKISVALKAEEDACDTDYTTIAAQEELLSALFEEENVQCELSLVTEGPAFTRFIFHTDYLVEADTVKAVASKADERLSLPFPVNAYFSEDRDMVFDVPLSKKKKVSLLPFLKNTAYLADKTPLIPVGKDVNENLIFENLAEKKVLLVTAGEEAERETFKATAVISMQAKFTPDELQVLSSDSAENLIPKITGGKKNLLVLTNPKESEGLYETLAALPDNVYSIVCTAPSLVAPHSFSDKVVFRKTDCGCATKYLTGDGDCYFKTGEFNVRVSAPYITEKEREELFKAIAAVDAGEEYIPTGEISEKDVSPETDEAEEAISEAIEEAIAVNEEIPEETNADGAEAKNIENASVESKWTKVPESELPEEYMLTALKLFVERKEASISLLQRRPLSMNYVMAEKAIKWMAEKGYVEKIFPLGYWKLLIDEKDYKTLFGE